MRELKEYIGDKEIKNIRARGTEEADEIIRAQEPGPSVWGWDSSWDPIFTECRVAAQRCGRERIIRFPDYLLLLP